MKHLLHYFPNHPREEECYIRLAGLLGEALPVWVDQLKLGGALGISWNTYGLSREDLAALMDHNGLEVCTGEQWLGFAHRVDASINRDLMVAVKREELA